MKATTNVVAFFLGKEFFEWFPIVGFPARGQAFCFAVREAGVIKYDPGAGALLYEFEPRNRIDTRRPVSRSPSLNDALVGKKFYVTSRNVSAEEGECASHLRANLSGLVGQMHGLHDSTELDHLVELFGVGERVVNALPAGFENRLLMNGFRRTRNLLIGVGPG